MKQVHAADLFCGAGGTSEGMMRAAQDQGVQLNLLAINHWPVAINSHSLNHPTVRHKCESLDKIKPRDQVPSGRLHILAASPECTNFSAAAGGMPRNDQSRATAWHVSHWCADLIVDNLFLENVHEFQTWGPLLERGITWRGHYYRKGRPDPRRKGQTFRAFISSLEGLGYRVEYRVQCAADFGDPTSRRRLIIMARLDGRDIPWPVPTHGPGLQRYRTARDVIDLSHKGRSIFGRKKPLSAKTLRRIEVGLMKFCGEHAQPFLIHITHAGGDRSHSIDIPVPTVTGAHRGELALIQPFVLGQHGGGVARSVDCPVPTIAGSGAIALIQPFLTKYYGTATATSLDEPIDTITTKGRFALVEPQENGVDILYRMLTPEELQQAMSFPKTYKFCGTKEQAIKQIGNAVPVELARAHARALLAA